LFEEAGESIAHDLLDVGLNFRIHQFDFGLALELRVGMFDADDGGHAFARVVAAEIAVRVLQQAAFAGVIVDAAGYRGAQACQVGSAVNGIDGVGKGVHCFCKNIRILNHEFHADAVDFLLAVDGFMQHFLGAVQVAHKGSNSTLKVKGHFAVVALVYQTNGHAARDKGHFPEA